MKLAKIGYLERSKADLEKLRFLLRKVVRNVKVVEISYLQRSVGVFDKLQVLARKGGVQREMGLSRLFRAF